MSFWEKIRCKKEDLSKDNLLPLLLTAAIIIADQITKLLVVLHVPLGRPFSEDDPLIRIIHVRNKAIAFSIGHDLPEEVKPFLFIVVPILVLAVLIWYYFKTKEFTKLQRWAAAGIIGGGLGNIIDRIFRPDGVVDFIDVKFFGIFGWNRWPTFNIADSSVVVCCILLLVTMFLPQKTRLKEGKNE